jgi:hypothetical protein
VYSRVTCSGHWSTTVKNSVEGWEKIRGQRYADAILIIPVANRGFNVQDSIVLLESTFNQGTVQSHG